MSINKEIQSPDLRCEDCACKKNAMEEPTNEEDKLVTMSLSSTALLQKISTTEEFQSPNLNCQDCDFKELPSKRRNNEGLQLETLSSQVSSAEELHLESMCLSSKALPRKMSTKMSTSPGLSFQDCQCNEHPTNKPTNEQCRLLSLSLSNEACPVKILSCGGQSRSCEYCIAREVLATKKKSDEEIQSRSSFFEAIFTNKVSIENSIKIFCDNRVSYRTDSRTISPNSKIRAMGPLSPLDPSSYSRPELAIIKHISLILNVNFETHVLSGQAKIDFDVLQDINDLVLDASALNIESVEAEDGTQLKFVMGDHLANMGSKLTISLPKQFTAGEKYTVKIKYRTDPQASALQWLDPEQTSGKKHPYMFSQCQPIHARSILPCQDTPAVKFTYDAEVSAPEEFTVLMSALRGEARSNKTTFNQPMPLPSYLVAIAVGVLESRTLGPRSKVWSEKAEIERSAWEFADTEKYLQAAEKLCGPYEWTQYDLLVLPPSFPYGGMENPCLTFVTPTLLAGDRSQADVIVHEIMHSWTGNLVTNRNFEHFWLNEGFTVFLERKVGASLINDSVEAKKNRDFQSLLGLQELNEAIKVFGSSSPLTNLVVDLDGIHPDDAFSRVPYEKGSLFLRYLEDQVGGPEVFDAFLRAYLTNFRRKSLDTAQFQRFLLNYFKDNAALKEVDWDTWLYKSGMPPIIPAYDTTITKAISALVVKINDPTVTISHEDVMNFTPHQMIHLLQQLIDQPALPIDRLTTLGNEYKVNGNKNSEIQYRWLRLCVRSKDHTKISDVFNFVNSQGRMKYVRPLYRDLYAWEDVREQAIENFLNNEKYMMHVSAYTLRKDLHLAKVNAE